MKRRGREILDAIHQEIDDARKRIDEALSKTREARGMALDREDVQMVRVIKEIQYILVNTLEE